MKIKCQILDLQILNHIKYLFYMFDLKIILQVENKFEMVKNNFQIPTNSQYVCMYVDKARIIYLALLSDPFPD